MKKNYYLINLFINSYLYPTDVNYVYVPLLGIPINKYKSYKYKEK